MANRQTWTRRQFSQVVAGITTGAFLARSGWAAGAVGPSGVAFVSSAPTGGEDSAIQVFRVSASGWRLIQTVPATAPGRLLLHPSLPVLYALHDVAEWMHLPRGAVSAYDIHPGDGRLTLRGTQPLSLAATHPGNAAFALGSTDLVISSEAAGIYNVLPVTTDGELLPVSGIRKEFGIGKDDEAKTAAPGTVALHPDGALFSIDPNQQTLTSFHLRGGELVVHRRTHVTARNASMQLALSPCGRHVYTLGRRGRITGYSRDLMPLDVHVAKSEADSIALSPRGGFLLASGRDATTVWRVHSETGRLTEHARLPGMGQELFFAAGTGHLLGLDLQTGAVRQTAFDLVHGTATATETVAHVSGATSLVLRPAIPGRETRSL